MGEFLKTFDQANEVSQIPLPKPKLKIGFAKAKDELFSYWYKDINEHLIRQFRLSFRYGKNKTCVFSIKKIEQYGDQFILTEVFNLSYREIKHLYNNRFFVAHECNIFESNNNVLCFHPDCGYDNSTIILIGDVYCPKTKCLGKLCLHQKTFKSPGISDYQGSQYASVCQVRNFPF